MRTVRFPESGGPDVLRYEGAPEPEIGAGPVRVRVRACALNHFDLWVIDRTYPLAGAAAAPCQMAESPQFGQVVLEA